MGDLAQNTPVPKPPQSKKPQQAQVEPVVFTTEPIEAPQGLPTAQPIWVNLPRNGERCKYTSLCRSALNALILGKNPVVRSVSLRKPYAIRGKRLIHLGSLLEFIERAAAAQGNPPKKGGEKE